MKRVLTLMLVALTLFSAMVGCAPDNSQQENTQTPDPNAGTTPSQETEYADTIVIGETVDVKYLDPWQALGSAEAKVQHHIYEQLVRYNADNSALEGCLAQEWEISEDGLQYTFKLQPDLKFSNGEAVTEEDWQWSFIDRARDYEGSNARTRSSMIDTVTMPEKDTLVITLSEPTPAFMDYLFSYNLVLGSKKHFEEVGEEAFIEDPCGTGPYMLKEWKRNEYVLLEANPNYRFADQGLPKTKYVKYAVVSDDNTRFLQLQGGQIDIAPGVPTTMMQQIEAQPNLVAVQYPSQQMRHMLINTTKAPLDNIKVREALRYLTDKEQIVDIVASGYAKPIVSSVPIEHGEYYNSDLKDPAVDVAKAKQLLAEAGYPDGIDITISVNSSTQVYTDIATVLKSQWEAGGVRVNIEALESGTLQERYKSLNHDITMLQWTDGGGDPARLLGFICRYSESQHWYTGYDNKAVADLYEQTQSEVDHDKRVEMLWDLQQQIYDEHCVIPIFSADYTYGISKNIQGMEVTTANYINLEEITKTK